MNTVLMLAYVFPPFFSVGGSIRAVKFVKYLPQYGWRPLVLTIDDQRETLSQRREGSAALLRQIPPEAKIYRTHSGEPPARLQQSGRALRRKNRLAGLLISGLSRLRRWAYRYLLLPDAHITWLPAALRHGPRIVREQRVDVIWATCPLHSTGVIAAALKRLTGLPLVVDYRDDWIDTPWFTHKPQLVRGLERRLEKWVIGQADRVVAVTPASQAAFQARYPQEPPEKFRLIPNGCDLADFPAVPAAPQQNGRCFHIVHAGLLTIDSGWQRSPESFFKALAKLQQDCPQLAEQVQVTFTGRLPDPYREQIEALALQPMVREAGFLPQADFVQLLAQADLLLTINYAGFDTLVPGKMYEYWAVGGPPILLLDGPGAAGELLQRHRLGVALHPEDTGGITATLADLVTRWAAHRPLRIQRDGIEQYDRQALTQRLAALLNELVPAEPKGQADG